MQLLSKFYWDKRIVFSLLFFSLNLFSFFFCHGQVNVYPSPAGLTASADYRVFVNDKPAFVYASPVPAAYCSFDMNEPVTITIKANRDIKWVDVRPYTSGIHPVFKDSTITFSFDKPCQLSIELNGSIKMPLFIFANPVEVNKPSEEDKNVIYFKAGKIYYPGIITLKDNQTLYVEGGAVVVGVVKADSVKNIRIAGHGILDGTFNNKFSDSLIRIGNAEAIKANTTLGRYQRFLQFTNCENVNVEGVTLHNSTAWQVVPIKCRNVNISNIKIVSDQASDDGIDVVHCQKVKITNSFIRTKDDCIAIKAYMANPRGPDVDGIYVEKCVFWNALWGNALEIGFELNAAEVKNITFTDCDVIHVEAGAVFSIHNAGKALVSNVLFDNIRVEDARQKLFDLAIFRSMYSEDGTRDPKERDRLYLNGAWDGVLSIPADKKSFHANFRGNIKNIAFKNINVVDGLFPYSIFYGFDENHDIENISIENFMLHGRKILSEKNMKFYTENTKNIMVK